MAKKTPLRVGFDLDGVLLYNPARTARMPVSLIKKLFFKKKRLKFYIPTHPVAKLIWRAFHWSSLFVAPGLNDIKDLVKKGNIEAFIVTARYSFLEKDFRHWLNKMNVGHIFTDVYQNTRDEQPHLFKERMIKELGLDIFVEDNFDIIKHLTKKTNAKIFWIYNIFDAFISHPHKFSSLKKTVDQIKKNTELS